MSKSKSTYNPQHEAEKLSSPVRMDGVGEDQLVKDLLSEKFVTGTDTEVAPIAKALAELLTGQKIQQHQNEVIMKRFEKIEKAQRAWEEDKQRFLEEVDRRSESLITHDPSKREKMMVDWMEAAREAKEQATAEAVVGRLRFEELLANEPKEMIISPGIVEMHREGDTVSPVVIPEVIAIKHRKWVLPPNQMVEVPHTVAVRYREILRQREVLQARQNLMKDGKNESSMVARGWQEINEKYNLGGESMPLA